MTLRPGAWVAPTSGLLAGVVASWLSATPLTGTAGLVDGVMGAFGGVVLAVVAYGVLSLLEGWAAFLRRPPSLVVPLLLTAAMLAGGVTTLWLLRREWS